MFCLILDLNNILHWATMKETVADHIYLFNTSVLSVNVMCYLTDWENLIKLYFYLNKTFLTND